MSTVSFLAQLDSGILCLKNAFFFTHNLGVIHVLHFQIKNIFSNKKKNNHVQFETHFCKEALKV